jgi:large subunit ribosomal protein L6
VKGPKGELVRTFHPNVSVSREDGSLVVKRKDDEKASRALHGLTRALPSEHGDRRHHGYARDLEISGTGYRAVLAGKKLPARARLLAPDRDRSTGWCDVRARRRHRS